MPPPPRRPRHPLALMFISPHRSARCHRVVPRAQYRMSNDKICECANSVSPCTPLIKKYSSLTNTITNVSVHIYGFMKLSAVAHRGVGSVRPSVLVCALYTPPQYTAGRGSLSHRPLAHPSAALAQRRGSGGLTSVGAQGPVSLGAAELK
jgi:hypothetical protein